MDDMHKMKDQDNEAIRNRIMTTLEESGKTDTELEHFLGVGRGRVAHWRYEKNVTFLQFIVPLCEFLGTNVNYLFYGIDETQPLEETSQLSPNEKDLIHMYRSVDERKQKYVKEGLRLFTDG